MGNVSARLGVGRDAPTNPEYQRLYRLKCAEKRRAANKIRYGKLRAAGMCGRCGKVPSIKTLCAACNEHHTWIGRKSRASVTKEQFVASWESQNGKCAICTVELGEFKNGHADHDHKTGKFRAVLCRHCNHALGNLRDNPNTADRAAAYLRLHSITGEGNK